MSNFKNTIKKALCVIVVFCFFATNISYADMLRPPMGKSEQRASEVLRQVHWKRAAILLTGTALLATLSYYVSQPWLRRLTDVPDPPPLSATFVPKPPVNMQPLINKPATVPLKLNISRENLARIVYKKVWLLAGKNVEIVKSQLFLPAYWEREAGLDKKSAEQAVSFFRKHSAGIFKDDKEMFEHTRDSIGAELQLYKDKRNAELEGHVPTLVVNGTLCYIIRKEIVESTEGSTQEVIVVESSDVFNWLRNGPGFFSPSQNLAIVYSDVVSYEVDSEIVPVVNGSHSGSIDEGILSAPFAEMFRKTYEGMKRYQIYNELESFTIIHEAMHGLMSKYPDYRLWIKTIRERFRAQGVNIQEGISGDVNIEELYLAIGELLGNYPIGTLLKVTEPALRPGRLMAGGNDMMIEFLNILVKPDKNLLDCSEEEKVDIISGCLTRLSKKSKEEILRRIHYAASEYSKKYFLGVPVAANTFSSPELLAMDLQRTRLALANIESAARDKRRPWSVSPTQIAQARADVKRIEEALKKARAMAQAEHEKAMAKMGDARVARRPGKTQLGSIAELLDAEARVTKHSL